MANQNINVGVKQSNQGFDIEISKAGKGIKNFVLNISPNYDSLSESIREINDKVSNIVITPKLDTSEVKEQSFGLVDGLGMVADGLGVLGTAYSVVTTTINYYNQKQEEARQKTLESIQFHKDESNEVKLLNMSIAA